MSEPINILIYTLDDNKDDLYLIERKFDQEHIVNYKMFTSQEEFIKQFDHTVHLTIIDYLLNDIKDGIDILKEIRELNPFCQNIILTGNGHWKVVRGFFLNGAYDFINKNDSDYLNEIIISIRRALPGIERRLEIIKKWYPAYESSNGRVDI